MKRERYTARRARDVYVLRGKRQCGWLGKGDLYLNPGCPLRSTVWSQARHFSSLSLSFLSSKMGVVPTVLYLFLKVIGKLT